MSKKVYLYLIIVYGFLCQGIITSSSANNIRRSSDFIVRHKRVINHELGGHAIARLEDINYIVNIRYESRLNCVGAILSRFTVITAGQCILTNLWQYIVQTGSAYSQRSRNHSVIQKLAHKGNPPYGDYDSIVLIKVDPPFTLGRNTGIISLHVEPVLTGSLALVSGWGCHHPQSRSMLGQYRLRSITMPIMNHRECKATYAGHLKITNKHICTYDPRKLCATHDLGAPLVINNSLVGIHNYKGSFADTINPDVFIDVQLQEYSVWIRKHI